MQEHAAFLDVHIALRVAITCIVVHSFVFVKAKLSALLFPVFSVSYQLYVPARRVRRHRSLDEGEHNAIYSLSGKVITHDGTGSAL